MKHFIATAAFAVLASAFTPPVNQTYGALLTPNGGDPVTTGQTFDITWTPNQPSNGVTVSLVLCKGPSTNCVIQSPAIVEGIDASLASYSWSVPCTLPAGTQDTDTGYGMLIIVDGTGEFQYSTQFSVLTGSSCSSSTSTTTTSSSSSSSSSTSTSSGTSTTTSNGSWNGWGSSSTTSTSTSSTSTSSVRTISYSTTSTSSMTTSTTKSTSTTMTTSASSTAVTTGASPSTFTGAAALPTAFANAAGIVGVAVLGMMAL